MLTDINVGQLITLSVHNDGLKEVIIKVVNALKQQEMISQGIKEKINREIYLREESLSEQNARIKKIQQWNQKQKTRNKQEWDKIKKRQEGTLQLVEEKYKQISTEIKNHGDIAAYKNDISSEMSQLKNEYKGELSQTLQYFEKKLKDSYSIVEDNVSKYAQLKQKVSLQIENQHNQISNFMHESEVLRNKHEHTMNFIKDDIMKNVPQLLQSLLQHNTEQHDEKLKKSIFEQQATRTEQQKYLMDKIVTIEEKQNRLEEMLKEFEIQIHVMENNLTAYRAQKPAQKRQSRIQRGSIFSKKMPYDVIIQKVLLLEEQILSVNKSSSTMKDKIHQIQTQLRGNPLLMDLSQNICIKKLIEEMVQKISRGLQIRFQNKLETVKFQKEIKIIRDRNDMMSLSLLDKCEKNQIKKAFAFLQEKLKQVITLFGDRERDDKDAFIHKKIVKCLSCDKQVESDPKDLTKTNSTEFKAWKRLLKKSQHDTERVNQLGLSNGNIRKLIRTARPGERTQRM